MTIACVRHAPVSICNNDKMTTLQVLPPSTTIFVATPIGHRLQLRASPITYTRAVAEVDNTLCPMEGRNPTFTPVVTARCRGWRIVAVVTVVRIQRLRDFRTVSFEIRPDSRHRTPRSEVYPARLLGRPRSTCFSSERINENITSRW